MIGYHQLNQLPTSLSKIGDNFAGKNGFLFADMYFFL